MLSFTPLLLQFQRFINYPSDDLLSMAMDSTTTSLTQPPPPPHLSLVSSIAATNIPEIATLVGQHLSKYDLASCALVCQAWSAVYTPLLWKTIQARIPNPQNAIILPALLAKYGSLIRTLSITDLHEHFLSRADPSCDLVFDCPAIENVVHLTVRTERDKKPAFRNIIHRNRGTLRFLWLVFQMDKSKKTCDWHGEPLFDFPASAPYLQSLSLEQWKLTRDQLVLILKACPVLKLLSLKETHVVHAPLPSSSLSSEATVENLLTEFDPTTQPSNGGVIEAFQHQGLETFRMCSRLQLLLDLFPNVKTIEFYGFDRPVDALELDLFCESIRTHCHQLQHIWSYGYECSMLPPVLDSLPRLSCFRGCSDMPTVLSILDHASTLEEANLADFVEQTYLPLRFLETCPRLKKFCTAQSSTTTADVRESLKRGWACKGELKELRLYIRKISPALIEAIMQDLEAERDSDSKTKKPIAAANSESSSSTGGDGEEGGAEVQKKYRVWMAMQQRQRQQLQEAMNALTAEQREFQRLFSGFLREMPCLLRVNIGSGFYTIPKRKPE
ncbi:hypothetical protein BGZ58_009334 [Dissophora ornata]|nr:hypothetical protein BGZ58_009334 [Dissophora ornata]